MSTLGDGIGKSVTQVGVGYPMPPESAPDEADVITNSFEGGLNLSDSPEDILPSQAQDLRDVDSDQGGALVRAAGIEATEDVTPRELMYLFKQGGLDFSAELVAIDPPYIGVKASGPFTFYNLGIGSSGPFGWNAISIAGTLIFSNGADLCYTRELGAVTVTDISSIIVAKTFSQIFGRVFAGGVRLGGGDYQALGIAWSAPNDPINDWSSIGAGAELLISDQQDADKIVATRAVGFDVLGIINRYTLWGGYPTGNPLRPADFRPRVLSVGGVNQETVVSTPMGIILLSDDGVLLYNINDAVNISREINRELLPIDYTQMDKYIAVYDPQRARYLLKTPFDFWVYDMPKRGSPGKWSRRSIRPDSMVFFADQSGQFSWDMAVGSWDDDPRTWDQATQEQSNAPGQLYCGLGSLFGVESPDITQHFGQDMDMYWRTPFAVKDKVSDQWSTLGYEIEYSSTAESSISLRVTDSEGDNVGSVVTRTLQSTSGRVRRQRIYCNFTGMNASVELRINSGSPRITRLRQIVLPAGPKLVP